MAKIRLLLRELRLARDLSQEELARALNLSRQSIIALEHGAYLPSSPVLLGLMEFFNCSLEDLVSGIRLQPTIHQTTPELEKGGETPMAITPWSPFQAIDRMHDEMSDLLEKNWARGDWTRALGTTAGVMNIHENDKEYEIAVQVPGYSETDLNLELTKDTLTISGTRGHDEEKKEDKNLIRREWERSEFVRSIRFAQPIRDDAVEAKLENGTLTIIAPKVEPIKPKIKKIEVKKK
jgi:HSP20 family protein